MSKERLLRTNLIGKRIEVGGIQGIIIDETKNMLTVKEGKQEKKIIKKNHVMIIDGKEINGEEIIGRTEERLRKKR